jgi:hypothetical protein
MSRCDGELLVISALRRIGREREKQRKREREKE